MIDRRSLIGASLALAAGPVLADTPGQRLARAAERQVGVTVGYDPAYLRLPYPGGDPPRTTGVCADVVIRAARDGLALDLQRLVHEDMAGAFAAYPSRRVWGLSRPDRNIDHRRVLNLETYWTRQGARLWRAARPTAGDAFPTAPAEGDLLTWLVAGRLPHVGVAVGGGRVVHNIGGGARREPLSAFRPHIAVAHYRWPRSPVAA